MHDKSARDGRMKIGGGRGEEKFKDVRRFTKVLEGQRRESTGYEGQKEGGRSYYAAAQQGMREASTEDGRWRFLFKRHQRACRKFSPVLHPRFLPLSLSPFSPRALLAARHTLRRSYAVVFHPPAYTRTHDASQARVPEFRAVV